MKISTLKVSSNDQTSDANVTILILEATNLTNLH